MTLLESLYASFKTEGRLKRTEYFVELLFVATLNNMAAFAILASRTNYLAIVLLVLFILFWLTIFIVETVRRLHDIGLSGTNAWIIFIPFIGGLLLLYLIFAPGDKGDNKFGSNPRVSNLPYTTT